MRATSSMSYLNLVRSGILGEKQLLAWITLSENGPMTGNELSKAASSNGLWKRLSELKSLGLVKEREPRPCRVTGRMSLVWEATMIEGCDAIAKPESKAVRQFYVALNKYGNVVCSDKKRGPIERLMQLFPKQVNEIIEVKEVKKKAV